MRGYHDYPHLVRIHAEQGSNLGVLLCAFQPEEIGVADFVIAAVVADEYVLFAVVVGLRPVKKKKIKEGQTRPFNHRGYASMPNLKCKW